MGGVKGVPGPVPGPGGAWSGGVPAPRVCACSQGVCLLLGRAWSKGGAWWRPPRTATAAGGMHPTGMHSCFVNILPKTE